MRSGDLQSHNLSLRIDYIEVFRHISESSIILSVSEKLSGYDF
jgi:hypothetical protein